MNNEQGMENYERINFIIQNSLFNIRYSIWKGKEFKHLNTERIHAWT